MRHLLLIALLAVSGWGANYYVDTISTGANNGTSWENAWQDFHSINWSSIQPGDTVFISGGSDTVHYFDTLKIQKAGTITSPIVFTIGRENGHNGKAVLNKMIYAHYSRNFITINGGINKNIIVRDTSGANGVSIYMCNNFKVKNLIVEKGKNNGIYVNYKSFFIEIDSCIVRDFVWDGININVSDGFPNLDTLTDKYGLFKIKNCHFSYMGDDLIQFGSFGATIDNCFFQQSDRPFTQGAHADAVQINPERKYVRISNSIFKNAIQGAFIEKTKGPILVYNNIFYEDYWDAAFANRRGVAINKSVAGLEDLILVANNVFYKMDWTAILFNAQEYLSGTDQMLISNNIFIDCQRYFLGTYESKYVSGTNIFHISPDYVGTPPENPDSGLFIDPKVVDYNNYNFELQSSSPAIDAGTDLSSYFNVDKYYIERPQGSEWDIGAYEVLNENTPPTITVQPTIIAKSSMDSRRRGIGSFRNRRGL